MRLLLDLAVTHIIGRGRQTLVAILGTAHEPTGSLDSHSSEQVFAILSALVRERGKTVIAVTHDVELAARMDRRIHLVDGVVASDERNGTGR